MQKVVGSSPISRFKALQMGAVVGVAAVDRSWA
jgi:hypothetical protein